MPINHEKHQGDGQRHRENGQDKSQGCIRQDVVVDLGMTSANGGQVFSWIEQERCRQRDEEQQNQRENQTAERWAHASEHPPKYRVGLGNIDRAGLAQIGPNGRRNPRQTAERYDVRGRLLTQREQSRRTIDHQRMACDPERDGHKAPTARACPPLATFLGSEPSAQPYVQYATDGKRREEEGHGKARIPAFHLQGLREKLGTADPQHDPSQGAAECDRDCLFKERQHWFRIPILRGIGVALATCANHLPEDHSSAVHPHAHPRALPETKSAWSRSGMPGPEEAEKKCPNQHGREEIARRAAGRPPIRTGQISLDKGEADRS